MADKDISEMTKTELICEIMTRWHIRTTKPLAEFSREELLQLFTRIRDWLADREADRWYA